MRKKGRIINITIALCVIGFFLTIADFLALHDIHNEYVSTGILKDLDITITGDLPDWTSTKGEWDVVRVSYLFRFIFFLFCAAVLFKLADGQKN